MTPIVRLCSLLSGLLLLAVTGRAEICCIVDAPRDDMTVRYALRERPEFKSLLKELDAFVLRRICSLDLDGAARALGPPLAEEPADRVLPAFEEESVAVSGIQTYDTFSEKPRPNWHVDTHAVADLGYVQLYYNANGRSIGSAVLFLKVDAEFVPLASTDDLPRRLEWDQPRYAALRRWLEARLPRH